MPQNVKMGAKSAPKTTKWGQKAPPHKSEPKKCGGKKCRQNAKVGAKSATTFKSGGILANISVIVVVH